MISNRERATLLVGGYGSGKTTRAIELMVDIPYKILYGNELSNFDIYSYPKHYGLIIEEIDFKPDTKIIVDILNVKRGNLVLTSLNEKDVPKTILNRCKKNRLGQVDRRNNSLELAPNRNIIMCRDMSIYDMTFEWMRSVDRQEVVQILKHNKPADIQILSWLMPNTNPKIISFADSIKRRWKKDYFYEVLGYCYNGGHRGRLQFSKRRSYSPVPSICSKLGLKVVDSYIVKSLLVDEQYREWAVKKLTSEECKILGLKKPRRKRVSVRKVKLEDYL